MTSQSHPLMYLLKKGNVFNNVYVLFGEFIKRLGTDDGHDPEIVGTDVSYGASIHISLKV